jgi:mono/diheme cytochrome c family protein
MLRIAILCCLLLASGASADDFAAGRELYVERCVGCHQREKVTFNPTSYGLRGLRDAVAKMAGRSRLSYQDQNEVTFYLEAVRNGRAQLPAPPPSPAAKSPAAVGNDPFASARELFTARCASCHAHKLEPINPAKLTEAKLKMWLEKMAPIAKFSAGQTAQVSAYLEAVRAGQAQLPPPAAKLGEKKQR